MIEPQFDIKRITQRIINVAKLIDDKNLAYPFIFALTIMRRIDVLTGKHTAELERFYDENKRRLSDVELDRKLQKIAGYRFYNVSGLNFNDLSSYRDISETNFINYFEGFSDNVIDILKSLDIRMMTSKVMRKPAVFSTVMKYMNEIDLSDLCIEPDEFLELLIVLINNFTIKTNGIEATPEWLSELMCECLFDKDRFGVYENERITIYDPVCGTGSLLAVASNKAMRLIVHRSNISLFGQDLYMYAVGLTKAIVLFGGNELSDVFHGNTLTDDKFADKRFQYILADIPMGVSWKHIKDEIMLESLSPEGRFYDAVPDNTSDSQLLFVQHMVSKMSDKGSRMAFVTTDEALLSFKSGDNKIRRTFFENDMVEAIIRLPIKHQRWAKCLWIMTNKKDPERVGKVLIIDAKEIGDTPSRKAILNIVDTYKTRILDINSKIVTNDELGRYKVTLLKNGEKLRDNITVPLSRNVKESMSFVLDFYKKRHNDEDITVDYSSVEKVYLVNFEQIFRRQTKAVNRFDDISNRIKSTLVNLNTISSETERFKIILEKIKNKNYNFHEWEYVRLSDLSEISSGIEKPLDHLSDTGLPYLSVPYLRGQKQDVELYESEKFATPNDALIISTGGNAGEAFKGVEGIVSKSLILIRPKTNAVDPKFLYYLLKGNEGLFRERANMSGVIARLPISFVSSLYVKIPPLHIQQDIARELEQLSAVTDKLCELLLSRNNIYTLLYESLIERLLSIDFD